MRPSIENRAHHNGTKTQREIKSIEPLCVSVVNFFSRSARVVVFVPEVVLDRLGPRRRPEGRGRQLLLMRLEPLEGRVLELELLLQLLALPQLLLPQLLLIL